MKREWKPGDVARIHYGEFDDVAVRLDPRNWAVAGGTVRDAGVEIAYPLVVIDPEDREQVERLVKVYNNGEVEDEWTTAMQAALRSLVAPAKPEEPTGRYAVVEDSDAVEWVRAELVGVAQWHSINRELSRWSEWDDIDAVKVLSEGVTQ